MLKNYFYEKEQQIFFVYTGLSLELFINQYQYVGQMNHAAGVRVLVHDQNAMPFPEDSAISVPTGQETFIGVNKVCFL